MTSSSTSEITLGGGGTLVPSASFIFQVQASSGSSEAPSANWTVQVSDDSGGASPSSCSGSLGTSISGTGADTTAPTISDISVGEVTDTSAKITWTTNESADSAVEYGTTDDYGSTKSDSSSVTSHTIALTGLTKNTQYHYFVKSTDAAGNSSQSSDATFTTAKEAGASTVGISDTFAPSVSIDFDSSKIYKDAPTISGQISDNTDIKSADYSTDDGKAWTAVGKIDDATKKTSAFSFTPKFLPSGIYKVKARARDTAGNFGFSSTYNLSIDRSPPTVKITTDLSKFFARPPTVTGQASDTSGISQVIYSLDSGLTWLPVDTLTKSASSSVSFAFTPTSLDDGTYPLMVLATDASGNSNDQASNTHYLNIDRLPPQVGLSLFSLGALTLKPDPQGLLSLLPLLPAKLTLPAVGGPTSISIEVAPNEASGEVGLSFPLTKNSSSGLWSTPLSLPSPGTYTLTAVSKDSAGNSTSRALSSVNVLAPGQVQGPTNPAATTLTVFYRHPLSRTFIVWDGDAYGQPNPARPDPQGYFSLILPPGTYYLQIVSPGFITQKTTIFSLSDTSPVTPFFRLSPQKYLNLLVFKLPLVWTPQLVSFSPLSSSIQNLTSTISTTFSELPPFSLSAPDQTYTHLTLRGQTTLLTFLNTWSPFTPHQLEILGRIPQSTSFRSLVIFPQQSPPEIAVFKERGHYSSSFVADPDGVLVSPLNLTFSPTHILLNRKGQIQKIVPGILTLEQIMSLLEN